MAKYRHLTLEGFRSAEAFTSRPAGGRRHESPPRPNRISHGDKLLADLAKAEKAAKDRQTQEPIRAGLHFIPMRFTEGSQFDLEIKRLENEKKGIRIVSAREVGTRKAYVVAVPDDQVGYLAAKFRSYRDSEEKPKNEPLASSISEIGSANLEDYWTGADDDLPADDKVLWWEVWLDSRPGDKADSWFRDTAAQQAILISRQEVRFPDRLVILARTSLSRWRQFPGLLNYLAEFRRANLVAGDFTRLSPASQAEFINELLQRTRFAPLDATRICLLDTGIDRGHPLLERAIASDDAQAWRKSWRSDDHDGHGTLMAGVCLYGDLKGPLMTSDPVELNHRLESVKILPPSGANDPPDYGPITIGSMAMAEVNAPDSSRVFCLAVTAEGDDQWRPTLWSAAIDQAAAGALDGYRRLLIVSAGNLRDGVGKNYPHENLVSSVEDPSQCWNGLTVGAFTKLAWMEESGLEGYSPVAKPGSLSPTSRTSLCWGDEPWPYKPDVVFEGGNVAIDSAGFVTNAEDLAVLTTQSDGSSGALLGTICDTSAAAAQAARMAAILQADYPGYWPETIRGLIIQSAEWTPNMLTEFPRNQRRQRLRVYGMGVPDLERARRSASGFATMVIQDELQPYRVSGSGNATNELHFHELPLPREVLESLGSLPIRMRVTLSYFIEPNPPRRGYVAQYQYASHGLRFSVRRPEETRQRMAVRLNREAWPAGPDGKKVNPGGSMKDQRAWELGPEKVAVRGSIHSDAWNGTAAELASSDLIAVHPVTGWWRLRRDPELVQKRARYSLIVSISTDSHSVDLYAEIQNEIRARIAVKSDAVTTSIEGQ